MNRTTLSYFSLLSLLLTVPLLLPAQSIQSGLAPTLPSASAAAYYYIAKPGELTMQVNVWGFVKNPGRYEVSSATDLIQLLSYAGGPVQYAQLDDIQITRFVQSDSVVVKKELRLNIEHLERVDAASLVLYPGDTIFIDHTSWLTIRDIFSVVTTAAVITSAIAQIMFASQR